MRVNGKQKEEKRICKLWKALPVEAKLNLANRSEIYNINDLVDILGYYLKEEKRICKLWEK
jgi:hypothetical protein